MSVQADTLYLPIRRPARVTVREHELSRHPGRGQRLPRTPRPRIYRVPPRGQSDGRAYGPDGFMDMSGNAGRFIDLYV